MIEDRIVQAEYEEEKDECVEITLRPHDFSEFVGQTKLKENMKIYIEASKSRGEPLDHVLFYGPPGLGKTTLAGIIASEMGVNIKVTSGPAIEKPGDLAAILTNLEEGDLLFIDEIHRMRKTIEEVLYPALEDFNLDIMIGKGPSARSIRLDLPKFTLIGATTKAGSLSGPLRDRFGIIHRLNLYTNKELADVITRSAKILGIDIESEAAFEIGSRSRGTPRIANRLLKRVRDFAEVAGKNIIDYDIAKSTLDLLEIDESGLDEVDRRILDAMIHKFDGKPVGLEALAAAIGEDRDTIEDMYEPYLMQIGFMNRTPRGRSLTKLAYEHMGVEYEG